MRLYFLLLLTIICTTSSAQNLDLVEGFYEILQEESDYSRPLFLLGDSSKIFHINENPVVSKFDIADTKTKEGTNSIYFIYSDEGTRKLLEFTSSHIGGKLGFVWLGSLRKIFTIDEIVDNGVIEFSAQRLSKVNLNHSDRQD